MDDAQRADCAYLQAPGTVEAGLVSFSYSYIYYYVCIDFYIVLVKLELFGIAWKYGGVVCIAVGLLNETQVFGLLFHLCCGSSKIACIAPI